MFTGIISRTGTVAERGSGSLTVVMDTAGIRPGDSVAVNGVCLTAVSVEKEKAVFDVSGKTAELTNLGLAKEVNIETSLKLSDGISGHLVTGHVDGLAAVGKIERTGRFAKIYFSVAEEFVKYVAVRGSVAINGVSLTVEGLSGGTFSVNVIPETLRRTNLGALKAGDSVNFEADVLARYAANYMEHMKKSEGLTEEKLKKWL